MLVHSLTMMRKLSRYEGRDSPNPPSIGRPSFTSTGKYSGDIVEDNGFRHHEEIR